MITRRSLMAMVLAGIFVLPGLPCQAEERYKLVEFSAPWCSKCKELKPYLEQFLQNHKNITRVEVNVVNTGSPQFAEWKSLYPNQGLPYLVLVDSKGKKVLTWDGMVSLDRLEADYSRLMK